MKTFQTRIIFFRITYKWAILKSFSKISIWHYKNIVLVLWTEHSSAQRGFSFAIYPTIYHSLNTDANRSAILTNCTQTLRFCLLFDIAGEWQ